jgi:hypothetical protein
MPDVAAAKTARKAAVLPRMIEVIVGIAATGVMANPFVVGVDVGSVGMARFVGEVWMFGRGARIVMNGSWPVGRNVTTANAARRMLRRRRFAVSHNSDKQRKRNCEESRDGFHSSLQLDHAIDSLPS